MGFTVVKRSLDLIICNQIDIDRQQGKLLPLKQAMQPVVFDADQTLHLHTNFL